MYWNLNYKQLNVLEKELDKLPPLSRLAFAASICERLLPNYSAFAKKEGYGDFIVLKSALDEVWEIIQGKFINVEIIRQLIQDCESLPPDEDDDRTYAYEASMTRAAILYILLACLEPNPQNVARIARLTGDLLFETILIEHEIANPDWSNKKLFEQQLEDAANHHFWLKEVAKQNNDLQQLKEVKTLDKNFIEWLRKSFNNDGKSLIDLS